ncbi:recombinase family protein [Flavobacteriaceae bacterium]|jgi:DNA invertase Pin-like site-specific DNA recombinase|nr:recombinase family protein [Flavobacteriaceae bacterium]MDB9927855.1 recombinase family protein [Flavobacteriaceae bacterium]|tara:strand:- start:484 stop:1080 length:597 start_codon:yes stop_codon:yes gene_type:complete
MRVKYIRVSTIEQNTDRQEDFKGLTYKDKCSGSIAFKDRKEATKLLANDEVTEVLVHSIDRLGRTTIDIMQTIQGFTSRGINVISEKEGLKTIVDGKENPVAKMMIGILGTLAEFELNRAKERQAEGIAKAKTKGVYAGRSAGSSESIDVFIAKESTKAILKNLRLGESIKRTALLSKASIGKVKKVKKMIKDGEITL